VTVPESYPHSPPKSVVFTGGTLYHPSVKWGGGGGGEVPGELCPMTYTKTWAATMSMFSLGSLIIEHLKAPNLAEPREAELAMEAADRLDEFVAKATAAAAKLPAWPGGTEGSAGGGGGGGGGGR
jgi:ubiquitin-protein ligase